MCKKDLNTENNMEIHERHPAETAIPICQQCRIECDGNCYRNLLQLKHTLSQQSLHSTSRNNKRGQSTFTRSIQQQQQQQHTSSKESIIEEDINRVSRISDKDKTQDSIATIMPKISNTSTPSTTTSTTSDSRMVQLHQQLAVERKRNDELSLRIEQLQITLESADINYELLKQKCMQQFQTFQEELNVLKRNHRKFTESGPHSPTSSRRHHAVNSNSEEQNQLKIITNTVEENARNIDDIDLRLQIHENTKCNGRILWKIDEFHSRRQQVLSGNLSALHSAPCYSSEYGYKFCLRVYLNGDGIGEGTHLSLFLVIMKSEHDRILEWPFQKTVKMTLINQQNRKRDHIELMTPNKDSASFQRPKSETNIASGCPLFIALDRLDAEGFLKEDVLFFDVSVV